MKVFLSVALVVLLACAASAEEVAEAPVCEPGVEFYPDPIDCTKFYQCSEGIPLHKECSPGLYWNAVLNTCDFPQASGCVVSTTDPTAGTTSDGSTTPTTTPNSTATTGLTTTPTSGTGTTSSTTTGLPTDTTTVTGTGTSSSTTTGLPTETTTGTGGTGTSGSSTTGLPTETTTGTGGTGTSGSSTTGLPTETTTGTGTGTSSSTTTGLPTETTTGTGTPSSTTTGLPTEEPPTEQTTSSISTSSQEPSTEPPGGLPDSCPAVDDPLHIIRLPHETNCEFYYRCTNGVKVVYSCSSTGSSHFSPTLRICQDANVAGCDRCPPVEDISHVVRLPHETECHLYYLCEDGKKILYQCRIEWEFSRNVRECLEVEQAQCALRK